MLLFSCISVTIIIVIIIIISSSSYAKDPNKPGSKITDYWETSQKEVLADPKKLLDDLMNFDKELYTLSLSIYIYREIEREREMYTYVYKDNIPEKIIQTVAPYMERDDFEPSAIKKARTSM